MQSQVLFEIYLLGETITGTQSGAIHSNILIPDENLILDCEKEEMGIIEKIEGTWLSSLKDDCKVITTNSVLISIKHLTSVNLRD